MGLNFRENPEELFQGTYSSTSFRKKKHFYPKPPVVMAGRRPAMTTAVGRRPTAGWLFKKTAIWRCEIVMESDRVSYLKVSRGYMVLSMILDLHVHFP